MSREAIEQRIRGLATEELHPETVRRLANEFGPDYDRIHEAAGKRGGLDQGVEVDSLTFLLQALEQAEQLDCGTAGSRPDGGLCSADARCVRCTDAAGYERKMQELHNLMTGVQEQRRRTEASLDKLVAERERLQAELLGNQVGPPSLAFRKLADRVTEGLRDDLCESDEHDSQPGRCRPQCAMCQRLNVARIAYGLEPVGHYGPQADAGAMGATP